jgi:hypothetical protein
MTPLSAELLPFSRDVAPVLRPDPTLPLPLLPASVDLRDFPFMPMESQRLFSSEFHAQATDAEWRAGVTLWLKSFHQVPAASLPDDDIALARLAEFGRNVRSWMRVRRGALRGWMRCADGRLYHRVVAEKALEAWVEKLMQRKSGGAGNAVRWGGSFDPAIVEAELIEALARLKSLSPHSRVFNKRGVRACLAEPKPLESNDVDSRDRIAAGVATGSQVKGRDYKNPYSPQAGDAGLSQSEPPKVPSTPRRPPPVADGWPEDAFDRWWAIYPRRDARKKAQAAFDKLRARRSISFDDLMSRTAALAQTPKGRNEGARSGQDIRPQGSAFLNGERFFDPIETWNGAPKTGSQAPPSMPTRDPSTFTDNDWLDRVRMYQGGQKWPSTLWGPEPGAAGCRVPLHLLNPPESHAGASHGQH